MVRKWDVGDLNVLVGINPDRFQIDRQFRVLERARGNAEHQRLARLLACDRLRLQRSDIVWLEVEPFPRDQDVVTASPSAHPLYRNILADGPDEMLGRGVAD